MTTLICRIELNKEDGKGIIVSVEDEDGNTTQTFQMDGTAITTTVKGEETSTITQTHDKIAIVCKDFTLDASGTITCTSEGATSHVSKDAFSVESTGEMKHTSKAGYTVEATADIALEGANLTAKAKTGDLTLEALSNASMKGSTGKAEIEGLTGATLTASAGEAGLSGLQAKVEGSITADVKGAMTTVEGSGMCSVKGGMVMIG